jgi:aspartyl-tRNA synthetase
MSGKGKGGKGEKGEKDAVKAVTAGVQNVQVSERIEREYVPIEKIGLNLADQQIWIHGRLHTSRSKGKFAFLVVRMQTHTVQCMVMQGETISKAMVKFSASVSKESLINIHGTVRKVETKVESCSQQDVEVHVDEIWCVSAASRLPLLVEDAMRPETDELAKANQDTRLDNRVIDLRTPVNQAIYRMEAGVCR